MAKRQRPRDKSGEVKISPETMRLLSGGSPGALITSPVAGVPVSLDMARAASEALEDHTRRTALGIQIREARALREQHRANGTDHLADARYLKLTVDPRHRAGRAILDGSWAEGLETEEKGGGPVKS